MGFNWKTVCRFHTKKRIKKKFEGSKASTGAHGPQKQGFLANMVEIIRSFPQDLRVRRKYKFFKIKAIFSVKKEYFFIRIIERKKHQRTIFKSPQGFFTLIVQMI